jgi:hypothetical protein
LSAVTLDGKLNPAALLSSMRDIEAKQSLKGSPSALEFPAESVPISEQFNENFKKIILKNEFKRYERLKDNVDLEFKKVEKYIDKSARREHKFLEEIVNVKPNSVKAMLEKPKKLKRVSLALMASQLKGHQAHQGESNFKSRSGFGAKKYSVNDWSARAPQAEALQHTRGGSFDKSASMDMFSLALESNISSLSNRHMNVNVRKQHQNEMKLIDTDVCLQDYLQSLPTKRRIMNTMKIK